MEYAGYHVSSYVQPKPVEDYSGCERVYSDRGPVDYSTHSPQSTISEERYGVLINTCRYNNS